MIAELRRRPPSLPFFEQAAQLEQDSHPGVPVISPHGGNSVARSGLSLLGSLGLGELAAATAESYVDTRFEELLRTAWQLSG